MAASQEELHHGAAPGDGPPDFVSGCRLTVDLEALADNWRALSRLSAPARCAGIVKADAYGLGLAAVGPALARAGCAEFFVALPAEGLALRAVLPDARIYVLNGLFGQEAADLYEQNRLTPVLNSPSDAHVWEGHCARLGALRDAAIHVDTGMNRLGMSPREAVALGEEIAMTGRLRPVLVMSHLACADEREHPANRAQFEAFRAVREAFRGVPASLANSSGILLGRDVHFDMTRPGIAVYGGAPAPSVRMKTVATAEARVAQIRYARAGETVSYGATTTLRRDTIIAVAAAGYADGLHRSASGSGVPLRETAAEGGHGFFAGRKIPILGRVTMDLTMFDVTDCGDGVVKTGDFIELFGPNLPLEDAAGAAGTNAYEMLTSLGRRYDRRHVGLPEGANR